MSKNVVRLGLGVLGLSFVLAALPLTVAAAGLPVTSLNDLPKEWNGVAGDLLTTVPAKLVIQHIQSANHVDTPEGYQATYTVDSTLSLGDARTLAVKEIELNVDNSYKNVLWVSFKTGDDLVPSLSAAITYDEATNTYTLKEMPRLGNERRFVLKAQN